jgi:hypothetical protein
MDPTNLKSKIMPRGRIKMQFILYEMFYKAQCNSDKDNDDNEDCNENEAKGKRQLFCNDI